MQGSLRRCLRAQPRVGSCLVFKELRACGDKGSRHPARSLRSSTPGTAKRQRLPGTPSPITRGDNSRRTPKPARDLRGWGGSGHPQPLATAPLLPPHADTVPHPPRRGSTLKAGAGTGPKQGSLTHQGLGRGARRGPEGAERVLSGSKGQANREGDRCFSQGHGKDQAPAKEAASQRAPPASGGAALRCWPEAQQSLQWGNEQEFTTEAPAWRSPAYCLCPLLAPRNASVSTALCGPPGTQAGVGRGRLQRLQRQDGARRTGRAGHCSRAPQLHTDFLQGWEGRGGNPGHSSTGRKAHPAQGLQTQGEVEKNKLQKVQVHGIGQVNADKHKVRVSGPVLCPPPQRWLLDQPRSGPGFSRRQLPSGKPVTAPASTWSCSPFHFLFQRACVHTVTQACVPPALKAA